MIKAIVNFIKHPPEPIKGLAKAAIARSKPILRRTSRRAKAVASTPISTTRLGMLLAGRLKVGFSRSDAPDLSVILVVQNRAEFALACLISLMRQVGNFEFEVVIVDNAATGLTRAMLRRIKGVTILRAQARLTQRQAHRLAVERSRGAILAFVDPDARLMPGSLASALETIRSRPGVGAVVGKTIRLDAMLEEAGSLHWSDGSTSAYGEGQESEVPEFMFAREVDFSSGAFFLLARKSFEDLQESVRAEDEPVLDRIEASESLRRSGGATVYDPRVILLRLARPRVHPTSEGRQDLLPKPARVAERLGAELLAQPPRTERELYLTRNRSAGRHRVLYIDDRVPHLTLGAGFPRTRRIIEQMVDLGYFVTYYPTERVAEKWPEVYATLDRRVEVMIDHSLENIEEFLQDRAGCYDVVLISRPNNMKALQPFLDLIKAGGHIPIIYDAEALFSARTIERLRLAGNEPSPEEQSAMIGAEVRLVDGCSAVLTVSAKDARCFSDHGAKQVFTLSHCIDPTPTPRPFENRSGILFVGPVYNYETPNADSITWFAGEIFPIIRERIGPDLQFQLAGTIHAPQFVESRGGAGVCFLGRVDNLTPVYDAARVFVAPTRYAAGIPLKCIEAAALGLPIVTTTLLAEQLGWKDGVELLVADDPRSFADQCVRLLEDPELWNRLRANALHRIEESYSVKGFSATIQRSIGTVSTPVG